MARKKQAEEQEVQEVVEEVTTTEETQEKPKKEIKKKSEDKPKDKIPRQLYIAADVPATTSPDIRSNVYCILKKGSYYMLEGEVDNGKYGSFYKLSNGLYVNKNFSAAEKL